MLYGVAGLTNTILKPFLRDGQLTINHRFLFSIEWKTIFRLPLENLAGICFSLRVKLKYNAGLLKQEVIK